MGDDEGTLLPETKEVRRLKECLPKREDIVYRITQALCVLFFTGAVYGMMGPKSLPGTEIFALFLLAVSAYIGGVVIGCLRMPPLLGMLLVGFIFRNVPSISFHKDISTESASILRDVSLVIILLKAGLGLSPEQLVRRRVDVLKLSFVPCLTETVGSALSAHFILGMPWTWAFLVGFVVCALSAAVLVPGALELEMEQRGALKGIPTLLLSSVSIDNIVSLTGFMIMFSVITSQNDLTWTIMKHTSEPFLGCIVGAKIGILLWYLPQRNSIKPFLVYYRSLILCLGGLSLMFLGKRTGYAGAGALGCVSLAFTASLHWRNDEEHYRYLTGIIGLLWSMIEPFLFGLIGAEMTSETFKNNLGYSVLCILIGLLVRTTFTLLTLLGSKLSLKERIYVSSVWISKATVQAAVGTQALDYAKSHNVDSRFEEYSKEVLTLSLLSILITAPIGATFMKYLAPYLLTSDGGDISDTSSSSSSDDDDDDEVEPIAQVTVTDYGAHKSIKGILKHPKVVVVADDPDKKLDITSHRSC